MDKSIEQLNRENLFTEFQVIPIDFLHAIMEKCGMPIKCDTARELAKMICSICRAEDAFKEAILRTFGKKFLDMNSWTDLWTILEGVVSEEEKVDSRLEAVGLAKYGSNNELELSLTKQEILSALADRNKANS